MELMEVTAQLLRYPWIMRLICNYTWWFQRNDFVHNEVDAFYEQLFENTARNELMV